MTRPAQLVAATAVVIRFRALPVYPPAHYILSLLVLVVQKLRRPRKGPQVEQFEPTPGCRPHRR